MIRGKTYQNTWLPKKSRKLPVTISFLDVICSGKVANYEICSLIPQVITSSLKKPQ